jgi:transcriptional regulator
MYVPSEFAPQDHTEIIEFLKENPFGTLVSNSENLEPVATHLPLLMKTEQEELIFEGHIAKNNKHSELLRDGRTALCIFQGPHAYISSSVYTHENVPTWNYQSVHVYGTISLMKDSELIAHLKEMVDHHESGREQRLDYSKLPEKMLSAYYKEITGFRITQYRMEAAFKLSQNRNQTDFNNILNDLSKDKKNRSITEAMNRSGKKTDRS